MCTQEKSKTWRFDMTMVDTDETGSKITTEHRAKLAYVYIRQSSMGQVTHHRESTDLQYQLVSRAARLGWPQQRVKVIDEDLGKSGASASERSGFQNLIAEIGLAIEMGADAADVSLTIHPHPTLSETVAFAAEAFEGTLTDLYLPKKGKR